MRVRTIESRRAFTLVELLVVIAIITALLAFLMPALNKARRQANQVACASNMRQLGMAFFMFVNDHKGHLPACQGAMGPYTEAATQGDWLGYAYDASNNPINGDTTAYFDSIPQGGTIWPYLKSTKVYLCPGIPVGTLDAGDGSNGKFSYQMFQLWSGVKIVRIPKQAKPYWSQAPQPGGNIYCPLVATPLLIEEEVGADPQGKVVQIHGTNIAGRKTSFAQPMSVIAAWHPTGGNYLAIDGSVTTYYRRTISPNPSITAQSWNIPNDSNRQQTTTGGPPAGFGPYLNMSDSHNGYCGYP